MGGHQSPCASIRSSLNPTHSALTLKPNLSIGVDFIALLFRSKPTTSSNGQESLSHEFVFIGAQGHLSLTRNALVPVNYDDGLPIDSLNLDLYYHVDADERRRTFPIDPRLQNTKSETRTSRSDRQHGFPEEIKQRCGSRCVVSSAYELLCEATHRVQNGLYLNVAIHKN